MKKYDHLKVDDEPLTDQGKWVLEQVEKGESADLKAKFGEAEEKRPLRAKFLVALLNGGLTGVVIHRRGLMIENAVVSETLDLEDAEVSAKVGLVGFIFQGPVVLRDASFKKHLNLDCSHFAGPVDCQRLGVEGSLFMQSTTFEGPVDLSGGQISGQLVAGKAKFLDSGSIANFNSLKVNLSANFQEAEFHGPVDFGRADIGGQMKMQGSHFLGKRSDQKANFNSLKVGQDAFFVEVEFHGAVEFRGAEIGGQIAMQGSRFLGMEEAQEADFNSLKVGESALFDGSEFQLPADFSGIKVEKNFSLTPLLHENKEKPTIFRHSVTFVGSEVRGQFQAEKTEFQGDGKWAVFNALKVDRSVFLDNAVFKGPVNFGNANVGGQLNAKEAHFEGKGKENQITFNGIQVGQGVFFHGAEFHGPVDFVSADLGRYFGFESVHCMGQGRDNLVSFNGMKVSQDAFFHNSFFYGPVDFGGADIGRQFNAKGARFIGDDEENQAGFNAMKVGHNAIFDHALFKWPVDFSGINISRQFSADGAEFQYWESPALFHRLEVNQDAYFRGASFQGDVDFTMMHIFGSFYFDPLQEIDKMKPTKVKGKARFGGSLIDGQLKMDSACFGEKGEDSLASFNGLTVGQEAFFRGTTFEGGVHICFAHLRDLIFEGNPAISEMFLENSNIVRKLEISRTNIGTFQARNLEVKGPTTLRQVKISGEADLQYSAFQTLNLDEVKWPKSEDDRQGTNLGGLTFQNIDAGGWQIVMDWLALSRFNSQTYSQVEGYLQRSGYKTWADKVFIAGKRREVGLLPCWKKWPTKIFWGLLAGYGRKPYLTLPWIFLIVALGALVFSPDFDPKTLESHLYLKAMSDIYPCTTKVILSLDRFIPGVDLGVAKYWAPPASLCLFSWIYWYVQKLLGWILVPIALAAIYTRIK